MTKFRAAVQTWLNCRACALREHKAGLEVGASPKGLYIGCVEHGVVAVVDQIMLQSLMRMPPQCELCRQGKEHVH